MEVNIKEEGNYYIVSVKGELDASSALMLDTTLQESVDNGKHHIIMDCSELDYISSPGIGVFTSRLDEFKQNNITLVFFGMNENVLTVFKILGLDQLLYIVDSLKDAKKLTDGVQKDSKL
ncbi:STAS domain-containing protein [Limibacter armeniacum]|uniref:STAS domain-containing protein n=1 Tax=Limibacter armeniacum TaxID=466084 RepID=UPI002FE65220